MVVQLEPVDELYDDEVLIDVLGKYYHQKDYLNSLSDTSSTFILNYF